MTYFYGSGAFLSHRLVFHRPQGLRVFGDVRAELGQWMRKAVYSFTPW